MGCLRDDGAGAIGAILSCVGGIFLLLAIVLGLAVVLHIPAIIAAGFPDPGLDQAFDDFFGDDGWPGLVENIGATVVMVLSFLAVIFLMEMWPLCFHYLAQ